MLQTGLLGAVGSVRIRGLLHPKVESGQAVEHWLSIWVNCPAMAWPVWRSGDLRPVITCPITALDFKPLPLAITGLPNNA